MRVYGIECIDVKRDRPLVIRDTYTETEQVGFVTVEQMVTSLMISGERLQSYRRQLFDFPDGQFDMDNVKPDPTMDVGFDPADYSYYQSELANRIAKARKLKEVREEKTSEGVSSDPDPAAEVKA